MIVTPLIDAINDAVAVARQLGIARSVAGEWMYYPDGDCFSLSAEGITLWNHEFDGDDGVDDHGLLITWADIDNPEPAKKRYLAAKARRDEEQAKLQLTWKRDQYERLKAEFEASVSFPST